MEENNDDAEAHAALVARLKDYVARGLDPTEEIRKKGKAKVEDGASTKDTVKEEGLAQVDIRSPLCFA